MVRAVITPRNQSISIPIPDNYIGKRLEVLLYASEEVKETLPIKNASRFKGILTDEEAENYHKYLNNARQEWDRII